MAGIVVFKLCFTQQASMRFVCRLLGAVRPWWLAGSVTWWLCGSVARWLVGVASLADRLSFRFCWWLGGGLRWLGLWWLLCLVLVSTFALSICTWWLAWIGCCFEWRFLLVARWLRGFWLGI